MFDVNNVKQFNRIVEATAAKIVVSSSWRYGRTLADLQELFKQVGIKGEVIGRTPCFSLIHTDETYCKYNKGRFRPSFRGTEIEHWISENKGLLGVKRSQYTKYAIIDDDNDMLYWHRNNYFQVNGRYGLTTTNANNIIEFFNK